MVKKKLNSEDYPYLDNYPPLKEWLHKQGAFCQWQLPLGPMIDRDVPRAYVECWQVGARQVIVIIHAKQGGWNLFTDCHDHSIEATLLDAETRLVAKG